MRTGERKYAAHEESKQNDDKEFEEKTNRRSAQLAWNNKVNRARKNLPQKRRKGGVGDGVGHLQR